MVERVSQPFPGFLLEEVNIFQSKLQNFSTIFSGWRSQQIPQKALTKFERQALEFLLKKFKSVGSSKRDSGHLETKIQYLPRCYLKTFIPNFANACSILDLR